MHSFPRSTNDPFQKVSHINMSIKIQAATDDRPSRYPNVDFCGFPEAICAGPESSEMRWVTSMFEWTERVQTYDDGKGWNYLKELKNFVDDGMYNVDFLHAVSGIVTQGCADPPCEGASQRTNGGLGSAEIRMADDRLKNFQTALVALEAGGEKALVRAVTNFFSEKKEIVNSKILQSQTPEGQLYPSYRYQLSDFLSALTTISEDGVAGKKFYVGDATVAMGVRYGIVNAIMFLAQAYKEAIQYDACKFRTLLSCFNTPCASCSLIRHLPILLFDFIPKVMRTIGRYVNVYQYYFISGTFRRIH